MTILVVHLVGIPLTGTSDNPARSIAPRSLPAVTRSPSSGCSSSLRWSVARWPRSPSARCIPRSGAAQDREPEPDPALH